MKNSLLFASLAACIATSLHAQNPDSGRVVLETRLGGDSGQATTVDFRSGSTYRVEVRPARADILIRRRVRDGSSTPALDTLPLVHGDSAPTSWRAWRVTSRESGVHVVELTNAQVGLTTVRIVMMHRAPGDTLPTNMRRHLVFNEAVGGGPSYVSLDSGVVYRIIVHENVLFSTRLQYKAPPFTVPGNFSGPLGFPFIPAFTGEYRMDQLSPDATSSVQIYQEDVDASELACIQDPHKAGCAGRHNIRRNIIAGLLAIPAIMLVDLLFHKK